MRKISAKKRPCYKKKVKDSFARSPATNTNNVMFTAKKLFFLSAIRSPFFVVACTGTQKSTNKKEEEKTDNNNVTDYYLLLWLGIMFAVRSLPRVFNVNLNKFNKSDAAISTIPECFTTYKQQ